MESSSGLTLRVSMESGGAEEAVAFDVGGEVVRGNLMLPDAHGDTGVLFLHGYSGVRGGPHNLLTAMARGLAAAGVASLRFDFRGRGESGGGPDAAALVTMAEDALEAEAVLRERAGVGRVVLVGICSGGNVGIGVLDRLPAVTGLYLMSVYPFTDGDSFSRDVRRSAHHLRMYGRKLFMASTWKRMFTGDIRYGQVLRLIFNRRRKDKEADAGGSDETKTTEAPLSHLKLRPLYLTMVYGTVDPDYGASCAYFTDYFRRHGIPFELSTVAGASHNYYGLSWKRQLTNELVSFCRKTEDIPL